MRDWKRYVRERLQLPPTAAADDESLVDELGDHLEELYDEARRRGAGESEADAYAREAAGDWEALAAEAIRSGRVRRTPPAARWLERVEQRALGRRGPGPWIADMARDLRFSTRVLRKSPGYATVALLTLALGIGAVTTIFSLVDGVLLSPLPYRDSGELVYMWERLRSFENASVSYPNFLDWRERNRAFEDLAAFNDGSINLTGRGEPLELDMVRLSASMFPLLGAQPQLGRPFLPEEDRIGAEGVVILEHGFWQDRLGGASDVIGTTLTLDGLPHTIVGVMPESFVFPSSGSPTDVYLPIEQFAGDWIQERGDHPGIAVIGRLRRGVAIEEARDDMERVALELEAEYPENNEGSRVHVLSLHERVTRDYERPLLLLLLAVGLLLVIACTNVANLVLARGVSRQREIAIRSSLGANGRRIVRLLLTENVTLWILGGMLGVAMAHVTARAIVTLPAARLPRTFEVGIDPRVVLVALSVALLTGLLFGLVPALRSIRPDLVEHLKEGSRSSGGPGRSRLRSGLVVAEVGLAVALLVTAGLMLRSFTNMIRANPGFDAENVLTAEINLPPSRYPEEGQLTAFFYELLDRVRETPGVLSAATAAELPLGPGGWQSSYHVEGEPPEEGGVYAFAEANSVSADYFRTMGIPLLRGRDFTRHDGPDAPRVAIVDESLARRYWPGEDPIGKRLKFGGYESENPWMEVVGVVGHVKLYGVVRDALEQLYIPHAQDNDDSYFLTIKTAGEPASFIEPIGRIIREIDPAQPIAGVNTMDEYVRSSTREAEFLALLLGAFAATALLLAAVGLYGVMSQAAAERRHEIGVRMALGATGHEISRMVVRQAMRRVAAGVALGLLLAVAIGRLMAGGLFGVSALDPTTFVLAPLFLSGVALVASLVPARRALKVDPVRALHVE